MFDLIAFYPVPLQTQVEPGHFKTKRQWSVPNVGRRRGGKTTTLDARPKHGEAI
jgi:hypothetical protein